MKANQPARKLILIAEDEPDLAKLLEIRLQHRGFRTAVARDGLAALNRTHELKPDLLVLDLMMPRLHGFEVCRLLRSSPELERMPIVMLTALMTPENKVRGLGLGADDYVTKPFDVGELVARVQAQLRRAEQHQAG